MFSFAHRRFALTTTGRYVLFGLIAYGAVSLAVSYFRSRPAEAAAAQHRDQATTSQVERVSS